jgi:hypothetical protein
MTGHLFVPLTPIHRLLVPFEPAARRVWGPANDFWGGQEVG